MTKCFETRWLEKTNSSQIRERFLLENNLTLDKAIEIARNIDHAVRDAKSLSGQMSATCAEVQSKSLSPLLQASKSSTGPPPSTFRQSDVKLCIRCGSSRHLANSPECPAIDKTCSSCGKLRHFARVCRRRSGFGTSNTIRKITDPAREDRNDVNVICTSSETSSGTQTENITCNVMVNDIPISMIVDTASDVSIMNVHIFDMYFVREALFSCTSTFKSYTNSSVNN